MTTMPIYFVNVSKLLVFLSKDDWHKQNEMLDLQGVIE